MPRSEKTSDKFKNKAASEVNKIFEALNSLGKIAISEDFTKEDEEKIFAALKKQTEATKKLFNVKEGNDGEFTL